MNKILAIESSCDETAVAIVNSDKKILSNIVISQTNEHIEFGGVVPEIAARAHINYLPSIINRSLLEANLIFDDLSAIAATGGPGLIGGVIVGVMFAKSIAYASNKPFLAINHLEGHALTVRLTSNIKYPYLLLLISGGHCQFIIVEYLGIYKIIGTTIDDALGEAFDKIAKMMGFSYPGGPIIEQIAKLGNPKRFKLPKPLNDQKNCNFSFSGLKTFVRNEIASSVKCEQDKADMAASFQHTVGEIINNRMTYAINQYSQNHSNKQIVLSGGVAANIYLRDRVKEKASEFDFELVTPPTKLCTDNAAMIAWAAIERFEAGYTSPLDFAPKDRWII